MLQEKGTAALGSSRLQPVDAGVILNNINIEEPGGRFRADLYIEWNLLDITIPPLRERSGDIQKCGGLLSDQGLLVRWEKPIPKLSQESPVPDKLPRLAQKGASFCTSASCPENFSDSPGIKQRRYRIKSRPGETRLLPGRKTQGASPRTETYIHPQTQKEKQDITGVWGLQTTLWRME